MEAPLDIRWNEPRPNGLHHEDLVLLSRVNNLLGLADVQAQRFLTQDVLSSGKHHLAELDMLCVYGANVNDLDIWISSKCLIANLICLYSLSLQSTLKHCKFYYLKHYFVNSGLLFCILEVEKSIPAMCVLDAKSVGKLLRPVKGPGGHGNHLVLVRIDGEGITEVVADFARRGNAPTSWRRHIPSSRVHSVSTYKEQHGFETSLNKKISRILNSHVPKFCLVIWQFQSKYLNCYC